MLLFGEAEDTEVLRLLLWPCGVALAASHLLLQPRKAEPWKVEVEGGPGPGPAHWTGPALSRTDFSRMHRPKQSKSADADADA